MTSAALPGIEDRDLRRVLMPHIEEVARHARHADRHADIIREMIDGSTGELPRAAGNQMPAAGSLG